MAPKQLKKLSSKEPESDDEQSPGAASSWETPLPPSADGAPAPSSASPEKPKKRRRSDDDDDDDENKPRDIRPQIVIARRVAKHEYIPGFYLVKVDQLGRDHSSSAVFLLMPQHLIREMTRHSIWKVLVEYDNRPNPDQDPDPNPDDPIGTIVIAGDCLGQRSAWWSMLAEANESSDDDCILASDDENDDHDEMHSSDVGTDVPAMEDVMTDAPSSDGETDDLRNDR